MDACRMQLPSKINLAQSHQSRQLRGLVDVEWTQHPEVLPRDNWKAKGHLNQTRKNVRSTKAKTSPFETCDTSQLHSKKVKDVYTETYMIRKNHVLRSNRAVPYAFSRWQQVHHGYGGNRQQRHPRWSHEDLQGWGNDIGTQHTPATSKVSRHCSHSQEASPWQQSIRQHKEPHPRHVWMPPTQHSRGCHTQLQSPFR